MSRQDWVLHIFTLALLGTILFFKILFNYFSGLPYPEMIDEFIWWVTCSFSSFCLFPESTFSCVEIEHCTEMAMQDATGPNFAHMVSFCRIKSDGNSFTTLCSCSACSQFMLAFWSLLGHWWISICISVSSAANCAASNTDIISKNVWIW